ncbi:MAG: T9SS type A sorting domain-containing protein [Paludibacteraceae bacterium]|nr:T9SS type A sorting domain-containing protein [Paludibacteraceae bacterium]
MKKIFTLTVALLLTAGCFAQNVITYKNNALRAGDYRHLKQIEYKESTAGGANQVWDYSNAKEINSKMYINQAENGVAANKSDLALVCDEGGSKNTYFEISKTQKKYFGLESKNTKISFEEPIVDLKFPFSYGDIIGGAMIGTYKSGNNEYPIDGNYFTSADAWGTLMLPDGNVYYNTLRIKVEKTYTQEVGKSKYEIHTVRYQYFAEGVRYPVLIVLESDIKTDCNCACNNKTSEAFYETPMYFTGKLRSITEKDSEPVIENFEYSVSPNPFSTELTTSFSLTKNARIDIELMDLNGKIVKNVVNEKLEAGDYTYTTNTAELSAGQYTIVVRVGKKLYTSKLIKENK